MGGRASLLAGVKPLSGVHRFKGRECTPISGRGAGYRRCSNGSACGRSGVRCSPFPRPCAGEGVSAVRCGSDYTRLQGETHTRSSKWGSGTNVTRAHRGEMWATASKRSACASGTIRERAVLKGQKHTTTTFVGAGQLVEAFQFPCRDAVSKYELRTSSGQN